VQPLAFSPSSQAGSDTDGFVRRGSFERNVSFLFLLAVYFGVPIGVPLVRLVGSLRDATETR